MTDLRATLTALERHTLWSLAERFRGYQGHADDEYVRWSDVVALLREPPQAAPLEIHAGLIEREGAFWKAVLFFADESEARRALDLLNQHAARPAAPSEKSDV
jgi:hypothetical protein